MVLSRAASAVASTAWCIVYLLLVNAVLVTTFDDSDKQAVTQKTFYVEEELPIGTEVGVIPNGGDKNAVFSFFKTVSQFNLNHRTGVLTTNQVFDREALEKDVLRNGYTLHIQRGDVDVIEVVVFIKDKNDHKPVFKVPSYVTSVREDIQMDHAIVFPNAEDLDEGENAVVVYRIVSGNIFHNFKIQSCFNGAETYCLVRTVNGSLDVETQVSELNLNISACAKLSPNECSYLLVTLKIEDVNDNSPIIDPSLLDYINIYENATRDKPIFRVRATDADKGSNGKVTYSIFSSGSTKEFGINQITGEIYVVTKYLDAEKRNKFTLLIVAEDKGVHPRRDTLNLHVDVLDCNDERPLLKIHPNTIEGNFFNIAEGSPAGMTVGTITVTDNDLTDANNQITGVVLTRGNDYFALKKDFSVDDIAGKKTWTYMIYMTKVIDREKTPTILLTAQARDNGLPSLTGTVNYTMNIGDVNDNTPLFKYNYYEVRVNESENIGKRILRVSATDIDFAQNADISYAIISKSGRQTFYIDENTGEIFLTDNVDREMHEYIVLNVSARDHGVPPLSSHTLVNITILDANDNDPVFANSTMYFNVIENNINGSFIGIMDVYDADILGSDNLRCSVSNKNFTVNPKTCEIFANSVYDRELTNKYSLTATVTDGFGRKSEAFLTIQVLDTNDNMPRFSSNYFNISIHSDFPVGQYAAYLTANDPDIGVNAESIYSAMFEDDTFSLDDRTGGLRLNKDLRKIQKTKFEFTVSARDRSADMKGVDSTRVELNVLPPSNKPPVFEKNTYHFSIKENNQPGYELGEVTAKRPDSNSETFIKYSIKSGNVDGTFAIGQFGALLATKSIDYENHTKYELTIEADDILHSTLATNVSVLVSILDVNDNRPTFVVSDRFIEVVEGVPIGYVLCTCKAVDRDSGQRGLVTYRIKSTTGHFTIHPTSGEVKTNGSLDYETTEDHVIYIEASDNGMPPLSSTLKLSIRIKDVNDNAPLFYNNSYVIHVKEDETVGSSILTVNASDADHGLNGQFVFRLAKRQQTRNAKTFKMLSNGTLYLMEPLDREKNSSYTLTAIVEDSGTPMQRSKAKISILVDDVNDEAPLFEKAYYSFEVSEELPQGTVVGEVIATDADSGENGNFDYYLRDQDKFDFVTEDRFEKRVCVIKTKKKFDCELGDESYNITVGASDHGKVGRSSEVTVQIFIKNINDHPPKFETKLPYVSCVVDGSEASIPVLTVVARDNDKIPVPLEYALVALNETEIPSLDLFTIDKTNGTIFTRKRLDNLKQRVYQMVVSVEEKTINRPFVNYQKVVIFVVPRLSGVLFKDQCVHISQQEHSKTTTILLQGFNYHPGYEMYKYQIVKPTGTILPFSILEKTGILRLDTKLNRNVKQYYQLNVTAEGKKNSVVYTDSIIVNIYVIPDNRYPPQYRKNPEKYTVSEDIQPGKPFDTLKLPVDRDKGMEGTCIFSIEEPIDAPIKILPMKRQIMFTEAIDREKTGEIVLRVRVHDLAEDMNQRLSNTFTVTITVKDVNDNRPEFTSRNYSYVYEDARKGSIVANIVAQDPDVGLTKAKIYYEIDSGNEDNTFVLNPYTGALSTNSELNIDRKQYFTLQIVAKELRDPNAANPIRSLKTSFDLTVAIIDVNNKAPRFTNSKYKAHVKEGEPIGTTVTRLFSTDDDIKPEYKEVVYELVDKKLGFLIDSKTGVIRTQIVHDRETQSKFRLDVIVKNVASPHGEGTCVVDITIDDINDNSPQFSSGPSEIHIMENTKPHMFYRFVVVDKDDKPNAEVIYSIKYLDKNTGVFRLDRKKGTLWVDAVLDREQRETYFFNIEATNVSPPNHKCSHNVTIIVDDENDEDPVFERKTYPIKVNENQKLNTTIITVTANDADIGVNAHIEYSIFNSTDDGVGHFEVNQDTGDIYLIAPLDYEQKKSYIFQVEAKGPGTNSFDKTTIEVNIVDENDNRPQFSKTIYEFDTKIITTTPIGVVKATDADQDGKQKVSYKLVSRSIDFSIDSTTGEIRIINQNLVLGQYRLHVEAEDEGMPLTLKNLAEVLVAVGDLDNSLIRFRNSSVVFSLSENPPAKYQLGRLVATSTLTGSSIKYHIVAASNPEHAFGIDLKSGQLFVNNSVAVDYEKYENFFLGVLASIDSDDGQQHSTFIHVLVNLTDVNDNTPYILSPESPHYFPETNKHPFRPIYVYKFHVDDKDKIDKNRLKLDILSGNEDGTFDIDQFRRLHIVKNVDYETKRLHHLVVRVTDGGNPVRFNDSHFKLYIGDINDNPPVFEKMLPVSVSEGTPVGKVVATVKATDVDTVKTAIVYRLEEVNTEPSGFVFAVRESTGEVILLAPLDYEKKRIYKLKISAFDGIHRSYGELEIKVLDVNDHEPRFTNSVYEKRVRASLKQDTMIIRVQANDLDWSEYGHVQYRLNPSVDAFTIEQDSGVIFVNKPYKFPADVDIFRIHVVAFDSYGKSGSRQSSAVVELHVNRIKFPVPKFTREIYNFSVTERSPSGVVVGKVQALFLYGIQREMSYRIIHGNINQAFTIDVHTGVLKIKNTIDGEEHSQFTLHVIAEADNLSTTCLVGVEILDINDNPPKFEKNDYVVSVYENATLNTDLIQLKATDADHPKALAGNIVYSIHSGQQSYEWLEINETSGWVRTKSELDREKTSMIQLTIKATDNKGNGIYSFASLNVTVLDVNDNTPEFEIALLTQEIKVPENAEPNTLVFKANAIDNDEGENARVSYEILKGSGMNKFYMNSSTPGWVYTKVKLDYEQASQYNLSVLAYDHGIPRKEYSVEYQIYVVDENEFTPRFDSLKFSFDVYANMKVGSEIGKVSAFDKDGGEAGIVRYTIEQNSKDAFRINKDTGVIKVNRDLRRGADSSNTNRKRRRRDTAQQSAEQNDIEEFTFTVRVDNGPNTTFDSTSVSVAVNFSCVDCIIKTTPKLIQEGMKPTTTVVVLASIAVFLLLLFVLCMAYFLRKKGCCSRSKHPAARFCKGKKDMNLSSSVERELLNSGASSFDRLQLQQHLYSGDHQVEKSRISAETGLLPDGGSGTARSVSATDKASTFSFGVYHEQGIPESEMHTLGDTLSDMTLKDFEQDSVFGYPVDKMKSEPTKSLISRSTQESSLYSFSSNAHRNVFNFAPRPSANANKRIASRSDSHESLKDFMEEGGGEEAGGMDVGNLLYAKLAEVGEEEQDAIMDGVRPFHEEGPLSHGGSFSTIVGSDEDLRRHYNYNYLNAWRPQFHPMNSVFSEIGRNSGGGGPRSSNHSVPLRMPNGLHDKKYSIPGPPGNYLPYVNKKDLPSNKVVPKQPPIPDTNSSRASKVKQKQQPLDEIPLQTINSGRTSMLSSIQSLPHTPQDIQSNYTSGALSPNFTPAITPLVFRSPSVSSIGTQDNFPTQSSKPASFDMGYSNLRRADSNLSQLSRITLSDLEISDDEV